MVEYYTPLVLRVRNYGGTIKSADYKGQMTAKRIPDDSVLTTEIVWKLQSQARPDSHSVVLGV